jgi:hypothetical protein
MNVNLKKFFQITLGLVLLGIFGISSWKLLIFFMNTLRAINPTVAAAIVGAMATILVSLTAAIITQRQIKQREIEDAHRPKKAEIYEEYLDMVVSTIQNVNTKTKTKKISEQDLINYFVKYKTQLLLWGSPEVINAQLHFEQVTKKGGDIFTAVDKIYRAIRSDIGLSNSQLNNLQLIKLFLSDPDELDNLRKKGASNKANAADKKPRG